MLNRRIVLIVAEESAARVPSTTRSKPLAPAASAPTRSRSRFRAIPITTAAPSRAIERLRRIAAEKHLLAQISASAGSSKRTG